LSDLLLFDIIVKTWSLQGFVCTDTGHTKLANQN